MLCPAGDRGFRVDLPPGLQVPLQQWYAKVTVTVTWALGRYLLRLRLPLFESYLAWRHDGDRALASARDTAERIGWQAHTVAKRCENIRDRYFRLGVPGLRGPRALALLALLLFPPAS